MKYTEDALAEAVDSGDLTEDQALRLLQSGPVRAPANSQNVNKMYNLFSEKKISEDTFYASVLRYITTIVRSKAHDDVSFSNMEDAISASALKVWKSLGKFDPRRSSFARFVSIIVSSEIANLTAPPEHLPLEAADVQVSTGLSPEKKALWKDWFRSLDPLDRDIVKMNMDGLTTREIGELLEVSAMTVSRRLKKLKDVTKPPF